MAVKVDPNSQRLQLLEPFKPVGTKVEEAMVLLKVGCAAFRPTCCHAFDTAKCLQALPMSFCYLSAVPLVGSVA